jgi:phosphoribosylformylglycinamidine (FGAM) synthase-like amidotransferase family enzyme
MPVGHMEGNYFCDAGTLATLNKQDRVAFRYASPDGSVEDRHNANGSLENIAGVLSEGRNVLGMMPHPDRSSETLLGSADGLRLFKAMAESLAGAAR